ncbi:hypothetical protein ACFXMT_22040 [Streptomyces mirabilis]|uniref:hypothetical protein n=1 Tax=Streptomyces mirabilis TaxID=68239 RepID=UPI00369E9AA5
MINFSFEPRPEDASWSPDWRSEKPELIGGDFCLELFQADVHLVVHGVDLSVRLPGLPVVDFALLLEYAWKALETQSDVAVETSLTQHVYSFSREAETVALTAEYPPRKTELSWTELRELTDRAKSEAVRLITTAHPELRDNAWLREKVGAPPDA